MTYVSVGRLRTILGDDSTLKSWRGHVLYKSPILVTTRRIWAVGPLIYSKYFRHHTCAREATPNKDCFRVGPLPSETPSRSGVPLKNVYIWG